MGGAEQAMGWIQHGALQVFHKHRERELASSRAIFLFHGYGANAMDLVPLAKALDPSGQWDWYFPQAPLELPVSPFQKGYAWFSLADRDWETFQSGVIDDSGFGAEEGAVLRQVQELIGDLGKDASEVVVGGFSQGAILTSHVFHRLNVPLKGLLLFSGYLFHPSSLPVLPPALQVPFLQTHGEQDPVLPTKGAQKLYNHLQGLGLKGSWLSFSGGHEIPAPALSQALTFLKEL